MSSGVMYMAAGREFIEEARQSASSLKRQMPDTPVTIYTDRPIKSDLFDEVRSLPDPQYTVADSIPNADMLPYDRTVLLDTDTYICESFSELFDLLSTRDLAVCHAPGRKEVSNTPDCIREYNTGVVGFQNKPAVRSFLDAWNGAYSNQIKQTGHVTNQETFTQKLYHSDLNYEILNREYNVKLPSGYINGHAKIIHGNHPSGIEKVGKCLNQTKSPRVFTQKQTLIGEPIRVLPSRSKLSVLQFYPYRLRGRLSRLINKYTDGRTRGLFEAVRRFVRRRINK
jgi:hypothetical protein